MEECVFEVGRIQFYYVKTKLLRLFSYNGKCFSILEKRIKQTVSELNLSDVNPEVYNLLFLSNFTVLSKPYFDICTSLVLFVEILKIFLRDVYDFMKGAVKFKVTFRDFCLSRMLTLW